MCRVIRSAWTTDKDRPIMDLLAAEITARTDKDPGEHYQELAAEFGASCYTRIDAAATPAQKARLQKAVPRGREGRDPRRRAHHCQTDQGAPSNNAAIGGLEIVTASGWFGARPLGTEDIYKIYAESFKGEQHLDALVSEAEALVNAAIGSTTI
jgi:phosphoglucomutase